MSVPEIKKCISVFLKSFAPEVLVIKGKWGVGKTYFWNDYIKKHKNNVSCDKYAYVSLFGINSLDSLKLSIFHNTIDKSNISKKTNYDNWIDKIKSYRAGWREVAPVLRTAWRHE